MECIKIGCASMLNMILLLLVMGIGAYFRFKFDKKYAMPVIAQNKDLSFLYKWVLISVFVAIICFILHLSSIAFAILLLLIPFALYLNFKTYKIAIRNSKKENQDRR